MLTFRALLDQSVQQFGSLPALSLVNGEPMTYGQLGAQVRLLAGVLARRGVRPGDRVAILSESCPNWGVAYFAITRMGAIAVPVLPDFHPAEVQRILQHADARAIFISARQLGKLENSPQAGPETVFLIEDFGILPPQTRPDDLSRAAPGAGDEFRRLCETVRHAPPEDTVDVREDDTAVIIYTSGTTGNSKGVELTHRNLVFDAQAALSLADIRSDDRFLSVLPLSHTYECTVGFLVPMMRGACVYYLTSRPCRGFCFRRCGRSGPRSCSPCP